MLASDITTHLGQKDHYLSIMTPRPSYLQLQLPNRPRPSSFRREKERRKRKLKPRGGMLFREYSDDEDQTRWSAVESCSGYVQIQAKLKKRPDPGSWKSPSHCCHRKTWHASNKNNRRRNGRVWPPFRREFKVHIFFFLFAPAAGTYR